MWVAGVDGCRGGWVVALARHDGAAPHDAAEPLVRVAPTLSAIADAPERPDVIGIDIPIGLPDPDPGLRPPARAGGAAAPRRPAVVGLRDPVAGRRLAPDYGEACRIAADTSMPPRRVSKQGFMIFGKIREVDAFLRARPAWTERLYEVHPELAFWSMNGERPLLEPKKLRGRPSEPGLALRRRLLAAAGTPGEGARPAAAPRRGGRRRARCARRACGRPKDRRWTGMAVSRPARARRLRASRRHLDLPDLT